MLFLTYWKKWKSFYFKMERWREVNQIPGEGNNQIAGHHSFTRKADRDCWNVLEFWDVGNPSWVARWVGRTDKRRKLEIVILLMPITSAGQHIPSALWSKQNKIIRTFTLENSLLIGIRGFTTNQCKTKNFWFRKYKTIYKLDNFPVSLLSVNVFAY